MYLDNGNKITLAEASCHRAITMADIIKEFNTTYEKIKRWRDKSIFPYAIAVKVGTRRTKEDELQDKFWHRDVELFFQNKLWKNDTYARSKSNRNWPEYLAKGKIDTTRS